MFNFEKLEVWHKAIDFADAVYSITRAFPDDERFGLTSQMRRAAVSIPSNIAEGSARASTRELIQFVRIADASLSELETQIEIAKRLGYLPDTTSLEARTEKLSSMLSALNDSLRTKL